MTSVHERKQQERQARRHRIQEAARDVFAKKGYAKTSIEQVARCATLSVGAIYLYFQSKEDLYVSLLEDTLTRFNADLNDIPRNRGGLERAWHYLVQWAGDDKEGTRMLRLVSQPGIRKQLSDDVAQTTAQGLSQIREHFRVLIQSGIDAGEYRPVDAEATADVLWALFLGTLEHVDARETLGLPSDAFSQAAMVAFSAVENGLRSRPSRVAEAA